MNMAVRTTESTVTLAHPFRTASLDRVQPAGTYRIVTDEEEILGISFLAYRRTSTMLQIPALEVATATREIVPIDPTELDAILAADSQPA